VSSPTKVLDVHPCVGDRTYLPAPATCCPEWAEHFRPRPPGNRRGHRLRLENRPNVSICVVAGGMADRRTQPVKALPQTAVWPPLLTRVAATIAQYRLDCNTITDTTIFHAWPDSIDDAADLVAQSHRDCLSSKRMDVCGNERGPSCVFVHIFHSGSVVLLSLATRCHATNQYRKFPHMPASV
jgi:hypothetical protein